MNADARLKPGDCIVYNLAPSSPTAAVECAACGRVLDAGTSGPSGLPDLCESHNRTGCKVEITATGDGTTLRVAATLNRTPR